MSDPDREERKREYNRLAQREFRRRRKEHLKNLEQLQKEQKSEQSDEIERLRAQNAELRRENENLRAQMYGPYQLLAAAHSVHSSRSHSPAGRPPLDSPPLLINQIMTMPPSLTVPAVSSAAPQRPLRRQHQPDTYHLNPHGSSSRTSPGISGLDHSLRSMTMSQPLEHQTALNMPHFEHQLVGVAPYDHAKFRSYIRNLFKPLLNPAAHSSHEMHLTVLKSLEPMLPRAFKPTTTQLENPHYYGIDMIPFPALRDRLVNLGIAVSRSFIQDLGECSAKDDDDDEGFSQVTIWGEDFLNEMSWEISQEVLANWGWLLGPEFIQRTNFWRRQRGAPELPEW